MPHALAPWRRSRRQHAVSARTWGRPVAVPEALESRVLLCADHGGVAEHAVDAHVTNPVAVAAMSSKASPVEGRPEKGPRVKGAPVAASQVIDAAAAAAVPSGFTEQQIATGITSPTAIEVAPDGRVFVSEQTGNIRVIKNGQLLATPFVTVTEDSYFERGLFGVAFDPDFANNRFVYVYYTALLPGRSPGATDNPHRVSRFTADPANPDRALAGSEVVLYETTGVGTAQWHSGGAIDFGPDGKLYFTIGEVQIPSASQSLGNAFGKVHRINPDGSIPADNPFYNQAAGANRSIWAMGLRNPFTAAFQPGTGRYYINDVGQDAFEEINEGFAGANFGWPGTEGPFNATQFPAYANPTYAYDHGQGCSISGGAFYNPTNNVFPSQYTGKYFFGDFCGGWIRTFDPQTKAITTFATGVQSNVGITVGNDGALYYISRGSGFGGTPNTGSVYRIAYNVGAPPTISVPPQDVLASVGESATFAVQATGSGPFTYQWQRANGPAAVFANIAGATSATYAINSTLTTDNDARFRVIVTGAGGPTTSAAAVLTVTTNRRPTPVITSPTTTATYGGGETIAFVGGAFDQEDGTIPPAGLTWRVDFHHADHVHPYLPDSSGQTGGSFTVPTVAHGASDVYYRITLKATDSGGLTRSVTRDVHPRLTTVTVDTDVPGMRVLVGEQPRPAPYVFTGIEGVHYDIEAPLTQLAGNALWEFTGWSDGGARAHAFVTPADDVTVRASHREIESAGFAIEGESAPTYAAPMNTFGDAGASGGQYGGSANVNAATVDNPDTAGGRATYSFNVSEAGVYAVWARGFAPGEFDDSFWFRIDGGAWWLWDMPNNPNWTWDQVGNRQPGGGPAPGSATLANLTAGPHTITLRIREDGARVDQFLITRDTGYAPPSSSVTFDAIAPRVEQVYVASTAWTNGYRNSLGGIGYAIGTGSAATQLATLPWTNLNQVKVKFTEAMNATSVQQAAASVLGVRKANYALVFGGYDATTRVATWTLANNARFGADRVRVVLPHTATDLAGTRLDGNWTTGQPYASGNGFAGGSFDFTFNVLPGDVTRDRAVNVFDMNIVRVNMNRTNVGVFGGDINGDGVVNFHDYNEFRMYLGQTLPA